jgi:glutathione S-transferase
MRPPVPGTLTVYGDSISGNCLKVKFVCDHLGLPYVWAETSALDGTTRSPVFLALNPAGQVPLVVLADGRPLAQSNAIMVFLAEGSTLIPAEPYARARMFEWLFWEQYSHEPYIAVRRFQMHYLGKAEAELDPKLKARGDAALARMQLALSEAPFLVGDALSLADVACVAYTRLAHEGGFDLGAYPQVAAWVTRVEQGLGVESASR